MCHMGLASSAWGAPGLVAAPEPRREAAEKVGRRRPRVLVRLPMLKGAAPSGSSLLPRVRVLGRFQPSFPRGMLRPWTTYNM